MSYKTNPILNRIKINKGWKNPYLPTKTLNYSRDISLWFKVYLLLKFFLNLKKIQLVSFEIRFDQQNKKILYLRINKKGDRSKKRKKKKLALNKILKKIKTPMLKNINSGSIFFLYKDLLYFKKLAFWNKNVMHKRVLSKFWLTKPKFSTWLSTLEKLMVLRQNTKTNFQYSKKNKNFIPTRHLKLKFYTNKQKQLLTQLAKIKKKNLLLSSQFFALAQQKKTKVLQKLISNLKKEILNNRIQIRKISQLYNFLLFSIKNLSSKKKIKREVKKHIFINNIARQKLNLFWKLLKKNFNSLSRVRFSRKELPVILLNVNKEPLQAIQKQNWSFLKKNLILKKILHLNFLFAQMTQNAFLMKNYFLFTNFHFKSKLGVITYKQKLNQRALLKNATMHFFIKSKFQKSKKTSLLKKQLAQKLYYNISIWILLRKLKKKKRKGAQSRLFRRKLKKFRKNLSLKLKLKSYTEYTKFLGKNKFVRNKNQKQIVKHLKKINWKLKRNQIAKYYKYRLPYRRMHFGFKHLDTNFKFKYLIQDFVQKYFSVQVETKILHVLNAHKNKNFFRLVFSVRKKKKHHLVKKRRFDIWDQKQIFLASRLNLVTTAKKSIKKKVKTKNSQSMILNHTLTKKNAFKVLNKKELFLLSEKKRLKWRMNNYFSRIRQGKDFRSIFKYLMPTLIDFSHSFNPQLLASVLSKVIKKAKKQTWLLNTIKTLLQAIQLPKNVGYKIVLSGRINSKKKSRLIYITRKQITLQVFNNNMNFAYSQANARIGAFGVKIWVYSKRM